MSLQWLSRTKWPGSPGSFWREETDAAVSHLSTGFLHPDRHGYGPDVIALADEVNDSPVALSDLNIFPS
jgi:hypothetical protein